MIMKDSFKKFVDENRKDFDYSRQDFQNMWTEIQDGLEPMSKPLWPNWTKMAAAFLIIAISTFGLLKYQHGSQLPAELLEAENHYYHLISTKMETVQEHQSEVDELIWEDLALLDLAYADLKKDLKEHADNQEVMQAMIENYRAKLNILNQILDEIEDKEHEEAEALGI